MSKVFIEDDFKFKEVDEDVEKEDKEVEKVFEEGVGVIIFFFLKDV